MTEQRLTDVRDIVQVLPHRGPLEGFSGCLLTVHEVKNWGVIACLVTPGVTVPDDAPEGSDPRRGQFLTYVRLEWDDFEAVGAKAPLTPGGDPTLLWENPDAFEMERNTETN